MYNYWHTYWSQKSIDTKEVIDLFKRVSKLIIFFYILEIFDSSKSITLVKFYFYFFFYSGTSGKTMLKFRVCQSGHCNSKSPLFKLCHKNYDEWTFLLELVPVRVSLTVFKSDAIFNTEDTQKCFLYYWKLLL